MLCFAWNSRGSCQTAETEAQQCPSIGWFWAALAGAGLLLLAGKKKRTSGK